MSKAVISVDPRQSAMQRRRQLTREHVFDLIRNQNSDEEIRAAITDEHREWCRVLAPFVREDLAPSNVDDTKGPVPIIDKIGAYAALALCNMPKENQDAFVTVAITMLAGEPSSLVIPAVQEICRERTRPYEFVPSVLERIERGKAALLQELAVMDKIVSLDAGGDGRE